MEEPPDCEYEYICKFYDNCKPNILSCYRKNFLDGINNNTKRFIKGGLLENMLKEVKDE